MPRPLMLCCLIACVASFNCQSYTTGLEQSSGRVDEAVAISTLRAIAHAQTALSVSNAGNYGTFEQLADGGYLDNRFNSSKPKVPGYVLTMTSSPGSSGAESSYSCRADPDRKANNAGRHFYIDSTSPEIHMNATQSATANDETIRP